MFKVILHKLKPISIRNLTWSGWIISHWPTAQYLHLSFFLSFRNDQSDRSLRLNPKWSFLCNAFVFLRSRARRGEKTGRRTGRKIFPKQLCRLLRSPPFHTQLLFRSSPPFSQQKETIILISYLRECKVSPISHPVIKPLFKLFIVHCRC